LIHLEKYKRIIGGSMLTKNQRQVLSLVAKGMPDKAIADDLNLSIPAVKDRKYSAFASLGANNAAHAVALAKNWRLI
jgi:DNA-binding NarL/FixJ family response regulator